MKALATIAMVAIVSGCASRVKQPFVDVTIVSVEEAPPAAADKVLVERPRTRVRVPRAP